MSEYTYIKIKRRLCPSGAWDNGFYYVSKEKVTFPQEVHDKAIIENHKFKGIEEECLRITIDGNTWDVLK